jgi:hypothetical protein
MTCKTRAGLAGNYGALKSQRCFVDGNYYNTPMIKVHIALISFREFNNGVAN